MKQAFGILAIFLAAQTQAATTVTLLHFSDYHSHATPFYSEDKQEQGGIARAIDYLRRHKRKGALVFNGGDMINKGAPAWSDEYQCAEWPWFNGIVDAMAFGNHEADYGFETFRRCQQSLRYPILSANTHGFQPYAVRETKGIRFGIFAIAGSDFPSLVKVPEVRFAEPVAAARETVRRLREEEHVDVVILIGHQYAEADYALARAVPGIDLIFGTHGHLKRDLTRIDGTDTWFISPYQYLTYISEVQMTFDQRRLTDVRGLLVPVDGKMRADRNTLHRVERMQRDLESNPKYRDLFTPFAELPAAMSLDDVGRYAADLMRTRADAALAISTTSSFRQPLPPGRIDGETLRGALPYDNEIVVAVLPRERAQKLLEIARTTEPSVVAGSLGDAPMIRVSTTDYLAHVAQAYREVFAGVDIVKTGIRVREEMRKDLASQYPVRAAAP